MVLGDIKPDYVDLVEALGGQVITIGHGRGGINPLDAGNVDGVKAVREICDKNGILNISMGNLSILP